MNKNSIAYHIYIHNKKNVRIIFILFLFLSCRNFISIYDMLCYGERK